MIGATSSFQMSSMMYPTMQRPDISKDVSKVVDKVFSKIDTENQGYIDQNQLQTAFDQLSSNGSSTGNSTRSTSVEGLFKTLDSNSDNQLTRQEMTESLQKMAAELGSQAQPGQPGMSGMSPPPAGMGPPPGGMGPQGGGNGAGPSASESTTAASGASQTDSTAAASFNELAQVFDPADTNQDGTVSTQEAMAAQAQAPASSSGSASANAASASASTSASQDQNSVALLMKQMGQLMRAYGGSNQNFNSPGIGLSVTA